jgi:hypothetical protein
MEKKPKYPSIPMKDTVVDRLKKSATPGQGVVDVTSETVSASQKNKSNKSTSVFKNLSTTSDDSGSKTATYKTQKSTYKESKLPQRKSSSYFLQMKEGEDSKLRVEKNKSGKDTRVRKISGERAENKFQRVLKRS